MVNTEEFTKRLNQIMEYHDLSAASFADKIDVGRSSISHLLSGRNKPSLDFVMKIVKAFPEVELYWLLNGKGSYPKDNSAASTPPEPERQQSSEVINPPSLEKVSLSENSKQRQIQKIVIFYSDGSFDAYEN